ncbi:DUF1831 domain-containing protein [Lapidilactobacillus luobeiensis]|uniref:DUF1831 domain-containing protein n=1 Tax=Lapidilactobacillus luobeiensis TaxID=2950371 RepID=UPI0021C2DD94|nr:DUF1831 domain-containing protein [Lapidilactobacillus luobeiensis]
MAKDEVKLLGDERVFKLSPQIKAYTLRDVGFTKGKNGNFNLVRPLYGESPYVAVFQLKMTVSADLDTLKMSVTDRSGLKAINIFKDEKNVKEVEQFNYLIENFMERDILVVVS